jgi:hypothetical protein
MFGRLRAVLVDEFDVPRECVRPGARLDALLPPERHPQLCDRLRAAGLPAPEAGERELVDWPLCPLGCLVPLLPLLLPALLQTRVAAPFALLGAIALGWLVLKVKRTRTVQVPMLPTTVRELVIFLTRFGDHEGYRFSRNEIALKVRLLVAAHVGVPLDAVREDTPFTEEFA